MKTIVIYGLAEGLGGVETIILSLIDKLVDRFSFIIVLSHKESCCYLKRIPSQVRLVNVTAWGQNPFKFRKEFTSLLNESKCDIVWLNACVTSNRELIRAIKSANRPVKLITHSHGTNYENDGWLKTCLIKGLHKFNKRLYNKAATCKWACSHRAAEWFYGANHMDEVSIIPNGIDTDRFKFNATIRAKMRNKYECEGRFVCLHIGRLTPVKNQSYLLKVFSELCKYIPESLLLIAGTGDLESELKAEAVALGIDRNVYFLGHYEYVFELYNLSDVFLLPSIHEGMPLTLVEAQCCGLHCFVSDSISKEVKLTRFLSFLPISADPSVWGKEIASYHYDVQRECGCAEIINAGFDVNNICDGVAEIIEKSTI